MEKVPPTCRRGHELEHLVTPNPHFSCDMCSQNVNQDANMWGCGVCNYDLCYACYTDSTQYVTKDTSGTSSCSTGNSSDMNTSSLSGRSIADDTSNVSGAENNNLTSNEITKDPKSNADGVPEAIQEVLEQDIQAAVQLWLEGQSSNEESDEEDAPTTMQGVSPYRA